MFWVNKRDNNFMYAWIFVSVSRLWLTLCVLALLKISHARVHYILHSHFNLRCTVIINV